MIAYLRAVCVLWCVLAPLTAWAGERARGSSAERITVEYWDKWTGSEQDAMQAVVDDFNAAQGRVFVNFQSVSDIVQKTLLATAGGIPPDVAGVWAANLVEFADKEALLPLDELARGSIVNSERYL